jgi:DNA-directed RNA polymerase subunit F
VSVIDKKEVTIPEARKLLDGDVEELDPLQRRVLDYTIKFSNLDPGESDSLVEDLIKEGELERELAVQIANSLPKSIPEIRTFLGRQRIISEERMENILKIIKKYKSE